MGIYWSKATAAFSLLVILALLSSVTASADSNLTQASDQAESQARIVRLISTAEFNVDDPVFLAPTGQDGLVIAGAAGLAQSVSLTEDDQGSVDLNTADFVPGSLAILPNGRVAGIERTTGNLRSEDLANGGGGAAGVSGSLGVGASPLGPTAVAPDGALLVLEEHAILRVPAGGPSGVQPGRTRRIALPEESSNATALASDPTTGHAVVLVADGTELHEIDDAGELVGIIALPLDEIHDVGAITFAPSGDPTDPADTTNLYALARTDSGASVVVELSLLPLPEVTANVTASLINTIDTSAWTPPSPDPAGIVANPAGAGLVVVDSEVNEMPLYAGVNTWNVANSGSPITRTSTTLGYTQEPTGIGVDPAGDRYFISDDDTQRIFEVDAGNDGNLNTGDDVVTSFSTVAFGNTDPEDVAFNRANGRLYIIDGLGREVYEVSEGPNGIFDGIAPTGDDTVTNFDVNQYGQLDPEGIEVNGANGNLLISSGRAKQVAEVTRDGATLVNVFDIAATNGGAAGIALAAATSGGGLNMFIPDRGVDNNDDPNENDGKIYELSIPGGFGNQAPSVSAGPPVQVEVAAGVTLQGAVVDDGLPIPPGAVSHTWTKFSGPSGAVIGTPTQLSTSVTFTSAGTYVFRLTGSDGAKTTIDSVTVTVVPNGTQTFITETRVSASSDDAEQRPSQTISLNSSDLEFVFDAGGNQVVGMRFASVDVPAGATIVDAYLQFVVDEVTTTATSLTIKGQAADSPPTFANVTGNISGRATTAASVGWVPPGWPQVGASGPNQRTPQLKSVVQEIVARPGWAKNNAMAFIVTGTGLRTAEAYDTSPLLAPLLHVEYSTSNALLLPGAAGVVEGNTGSKVVQIPVTLSRTMPSNVSVNYATLNPVPTIGLAQSGVDFQATSGTLTIPAGNLVGYVNVTVFGDTVAEPPLLWGEWLLVTFSNLPPGVTLDTSFFFGAGVGIIIDDD